jgi:hypothetical protein
VGQDPCPEPNDEFQQACSLGPDTDTSGFISSPTDVDAYRFQALDFGVQTHIELASPTGPYAIALGDWDGRTLAISSDNNGQQAIDATLPMPGAYYLFVQSPTGQFSDTSPYHLAVHFTY